MRRRLPTAALLVSAAFALSGCGVTYVSPLVSERGNDDVTVVPITRDSLALANGRIYIRGERHLFAIVR